MFYHPQEHHLKLLGAELPLPGKLTVFSIENGHSAIADLC